MSTELEIARLRKLATQAANEASQTARQLAASLLLHAAIAHLKDADGAWNRINEERPKFTLALVKEGP